MDEGIKQITNISIGTLKQTTSSLPIKRNGLEVGFLQNGEERTALMRLIDFDHPERNLFKVVNQWRVEEYKNKRCDMVVMVNGFLVVELKSAIFEDATVEDAYKQVKELSAERSSLFSYNAFNVISDMSETRAGTITAKLERYMEWKTIDGSSVDPIAPSSSACSSSSDCLDILRTVSENSENAPRFFAYHQYYAVGKALQRANGSGRRRGTRRVPGKTISMVFYAHQLVQRLPEVTIVVVTDPPRTSTTSSVSSAAARDFLRQEPQNAQSREDLGNLLRNRKMGEIIFTTIQRGRLALCPPVATSL